MFVKERNVMININLFLKSDVSETNDKDLPAVSVRSRR